MIIFWIWWVQSVYYQFITCLLLLLLVDIHRNLLRSWLTYFSSFRRRRWVNYITNLLLFFNLSKYFLSYSFILYYFGYSICCFKFSTRERMTFLYLFQLLRLRRIIPWTSICEQALMLSSNCKHICRLLYLNLAELLLLKIINSFITATATPTTVATYTTMGTLAAPSTTHFTI